VPQNYSGPIRLGDETDWLPRSSEVAAEDSASLRYHALLTHCPRSIYLFQVPPLRGTEIVSRSGGKSLNILSSSTVEDHGRISTLWLTD
jgi:hypothetical protein